jgi:DNA-binding response OmpR family regulator
MHGEAQARQKEYPCFMNEQQVVVNESMRILIIDDEPSIADALKLILNDNGYVATATITGRDGLALAKSESFDMVITDLRLPDISGLEILVSLRKQVPDCPVIMITAHGTPDVISEAMAHGAFDVLAKPFFPADLLNRVNAALSGRR